MLLDTSKKYIGKCEKLFEFDALSDGFHIVQGGYYDGEHYYIAMVCPQPDRHELCRILVLDKTGKQVRVGETISVDHSNNLTYVPAKNAFLASHCQAPEGHNARYSFIDRDTLRVTETGDLEKPFFSMAFDPKSGRYCSGEWGGETLDTWDSSLSLLKSVPVEKPKTLSQGCFCDENHLWFVRSSMHGYGAEIRIYDWDCGLCSVVPLEIENHTEPESINIAGDEIVTVCNRPTCDGGICYRITLTEV